MYNKLMNRNSQHILSYKSQNHHMLLGMPRAMGWKSIELRSSNLLCLLHAICIIRVIELWSGSELFTSWPCYRDQKWNNVAKFGLLWDANKLRHVYSGSGKFHDSTCCAVTWNPASQFSVVRLSANIAFLVSSRVRVPYHLVCHMCAFLDLF